MAETEFERFKKRYPTKKDVPVLALPPPIPGVGGVGKTIIRKGIESGVRRFGDVTRGDKVTKMKDRKGIERKDPMEPRVVPSGRSRSLEKTREGGGGPTKMKDRRGLDRKPENKPEKKEMSTGKKVAVAGGVTAAIAGGYYTTKAFNARKAAGQDKPKSNDFDTAYRSLNSKSGVQAPVRALNRSVPARVKAKPADLMKPYEKKKTPKKAKPERKSKTRIAFEKEFAKARKAGKKEFTFKGGKYKSYNTKLK